MASLELNITLGKRGPVERIPCEFCGGLYAKGAGMARHRPWCEQRQEGFLPCAKCHRLLPVSEFNVGPSGKTQTYCRSCANTTKKEWRANNPELVKEQKKRSYWKDPEKSREKNRQRFAEHPEYAETFKEKANAEDMHAFYRHGILPEQTLAIYEFQEGVCAICGRPVSYLNSYASEDGMPKRKIDHDHKTGFVRGLLCGRCNPMLGWFERHREAIESYIENPPAKQLGFEITTKRRQQDPAWAG